MMCEQLSTHSECVYDCHCKWCFALANLSRACQAYAGTVQCDAYESRLCPPSKSERIQHYLATVLIWLWVGSVVLLLLALVYFVAKRVYPRFCARAPPADGNALCEMEKRQAATARPDA